MPFKTENKYQKVLSREFYEKIPKAVLAAIAVSYVINHQGTDQENAEENILSEWHTLHKQGVIPQKPFRNVKNADEMDF